ncbi:hypothetical protein [Sandaracinus amylolyticus]|uniref:hypothetical protein n=1 Tax=Sandaracinus amylolyticus TaxID=927083 RepID=UPI001F25328A|nr:hypothetical protein [Sandaracinus amylolyticus]UJR79970.1 Hypothetical protein I5071_20120 [Sandaracinus amylolyticus]
MSERSDLARRARRAAELGFVRGALRVLPAAAAFVVVLAIVAPERALSSGIAALVVLGVVVLRAWRRALGEGATEGLVVGMPVALAGVLTRACMPGDWSCGAVCIVVGVVSAIALGLSRPHEPRTFTTRAVTALTAASTALAGCVGLGVGMALAASLATAVAWSGVVALRRVRV